MSITTSSDIINVTPPSHPNVAPANYNTSDLSGVSVPSQVPLQHYGSSGSDPLTGTFDILSSFGGSGGLIGGITSLLSSLGGWIAQAVMSKKTRKWQEKMYNQQLADTKAMIADERNYNSPSEIKKRLYAAGINPSTLNGGASAATTNGSAAGSTPAVPSGGVPSAAGIGNLTEGMTAFGMFMEQLSQARKNDAEAEALKTYKRAESESSTVANIAAAKLSSAVSGIQNSVEASNYASAFKSRMSGFLDSFNASIAAFTDEQNRVTRPVTLENGSVVDVPQGALSMLISYFAADSYLRERNIKWENIKAHTGEMHANMRHILTLLPVDELLALKSVIEQGVIGTGHSSVDLHSALSGTSDPSQSGIVDSRGSFTLSDSRARDTSFFAPRGLRFGNYNTSSPGKYGELIDARMDEELMQIHRYINRLDSRSRNQVAESWLGIVTGATSSAALGYGVLRRPAYR